ncbi:hypothetical protein NW762_008697 [Fusarium torreyae]|uniref:AAA+ ATPase domain-containing protein n=1 Tax=Fusarium torreyae TaxID=1237075 RepID=A0A9W8RVK5_9HYPO|nr:hypothetical protein NW762_008697 [Fusarium torreyae]
MEEADSIVSTDHQSSPKTTAESTQHQATAKQTKDTDSTGPAAKSSGQVEQSAKRSSTSKKRRQKKKKMNGKGAEPVFDQEDAESSDTSDGEADSDSGDDKGHPAASRSSTKHPRVKDKNKNKKRSKKSSSAKQKVAKKTKHKKKGKGYTNADFDSGSDTDSSSDSASSGSSSSDEAKDKGDGKSSSNLESQLKSLQFQFSQFQYQQAHQRQACQQQAYQNALASYSTPGYVQHQVANQQVVNNQPANQNALASYSMPGYVQHSQNPQYLSNAQMAAQDLLAPLTPASRRGLPKGVPRLPGPQSSDKDSDTSDRISETKNGKDKKFKHPAFKRVDQVWDNHINNFKLQDTADADTDSQYEEFIFHVRRTFDWEGKYKTTVVDIRSKLLRECLQDVIGNIEGTSLVDEIPKISPHILFLYLENMRHHLKALRQVKPAGESKKAHKKNKERLKEKRKQLKVIIKYLDHEYETTKESLYPMLKNGLITFDLLWALWKPTTLAYTTTYGSTTEPRAFKVEMAQLHHSIIKGSFYHVTGKYLEFDGKRFGHGNLSVEIEEFQGARKITSLACYPLQYHQNEDKLRSDLIERGKKFVSLSGVHYKSYQGIAFMRRKKGVVMKFSIQPSRVMIDPTIFRRINPNYGVSVVKPKDHDILSGDEESGSDSDGCSDCSDSEDGEKIKFVTKVYKNSDGELRMARIPKDMIEDEPETAELDELPSKRVEGVDGESADDHDFTDEEYLIASPVVLGFAFSEKQWLELAVSGVKEIEWNEQAWDSLVLRRGTKDLIKALVTSRKYHAANTIDDVIQGKGKGLVTVLHGPPGTGKTLTAEGIGELLKCPLYMASAGELGTDSRFLEAELQKILDICHAWGAILLLDEADVFLEKRNMHDIHRNALVSIFLRQLEYFQGILFLTTNRVETFDEAFQSRIHIALRYDNLDSRAKRTIFKMFLNRVEKLGKLKVKPLTEDDLNTLSKQDLNGRQIKNVVGSAQDLAVTNGEALSMRHIKQVLDVHAKFEQDLKGGTGFEDVMRSYS